MQPAKLALSILVLLVAPLGTANAQQTTGVPGSPSATTTIDGNIFPLHPHPLAARSI